MESGLRAGIWPLLTTSTARVSSLDYITHFFFPYPRYSFQFPVFSLSVQFSRSVMPDSLRPHESQHARPPCPSPTPGVHPPRAGLQVCTQRRRPVQGLGTGVGCHALLQGIFPIQGSNPGFPPCRQILYHLRDPRGVSAWAEK